MIVKNCLTLTGRLSRIRDKSNVWCGRLSRIRDTVLRELAAGQYSSYRTVCGCGFVRMRIKSIQTSNKNFILKCRDGKRTETRIGMEGICITHSCIPLYMQHIMAHSGRMQEWVIQIPSIPILVSVLFPSLHLKYFRIKFLLLVIIEVGRSSGGSKSTCIFN